MIYIHLMKDLNVKTVNIESVPIIRELKEKTKFPITENQVLKFLSDYFITQKDIDLMITSSKLIHPTIEKIKSLTQNNNPIYEPINLYRGVTSLEEVNQPILNNIIYANEILSWYDELIKETSQLLNELNNISSLNNAKVNEERQALNLKLNVIFQKILRSNEFVFNSYDIINEGKVARMKDLHSSLLSGFFFHITVKEHLDKIDFDTIKKRISESDLSYVEKVTKDVFEIRKGIEKAYEFNMNMINIAVILFSYIKWLTK